MLSLRTLLPASTEAAPAAESALADCRAETAYPPTRFQKKNLYSARNIIHRLSDALGAESRGGLMFAEPKSVRWCESFINTATTHP